MKKIIFIIFICLCNNLLAENFSKTDLLQEDMFDDEYSNMKFYEKPPLNSKNIAGEVFVGSIVGGIYLHKQQKNIDNLGLAAVLVTFDLFITSGFVSGSTYMIGKIGEQTGSFIKTYNYSVGCGFVTWAIGGAIEKRNLKFSESILYYYLPGSVIGAVFGFNQSRRYDLNPPRLLLGRNQNVHFGALNFTFSQMNREYKINLLEWRF